MRLTEGTAELVGVLIGDGWIYRSHGKYQIGFVGNRETDKEYYDYLKDLIQAEWKKEVKIKFREGGIRIVIDSKEICAFLTDDLGIFHGEGKCEKVEIPKKILADWGLARKTIRGIADTDGSVFVAKKKGFEKYPSIEITTCSLKLAEQLKGALLERGFRVANLWHYKSKTGRRTTYKIPLNGKENVRKWLEEIGFSNLYKLSRAVTYTKE